MNWKSSSHLFYPKSARSRKLLKEYLDASSISYEAIDLYDSRPYHREPRPNLESFNEIVFTSSSGVNSFFEIYDELPKHLRVICKGRVTRLTLEDYLSSRLTID
ncbi:MAG: hypothetical protein S4CHLAM6_12190 [Chlamydiae bacterium]|nr:hypothetical protein [Chlamydiota bacterium]